MPTVRPDAVLVIAARDDWPTDRIVKLLDERGTRVFRMDVADFPQQLGLTARLDDDHPWTGTLGTDHRTLDLHDITAVYHRAPGPFVFPADLNPAERRFAASQARAGLGGILTGLDHCRWVSHPAAMAHAEYKPVQLATAGTAGLRIAPTLITNQPDAVRRFAAEIPGPLVCKTLASPVLIEDGRLKTVYTHRITAADLEDLRGIETTAHLFQAWAAKDHEVRLTAVGTRLFAAEVHAGSDAAHIDWRTDYPSLTYTPTTVPADTATAVHRLLAALGLRYAALDFVVSPAGEWTFLEANPCGQWDWIAHATGLPIAEAIADELTGATP